MSSERIVDTSFANQHYKYTQGSLVEMRQSLSSILTRLAAGLLVISQVGATALTTTIGASERSCYYADVDGVGEKIGKLYECGIALYARLDR